MSSVLPNWSSPTEVDAWIRSWRPDLTSSRRAQAGTSPSAWLREFEPDSAGQLHACLTVFLTNRECPWHCLMCDLWRQTTLKPLPLGAIPQQLRVALASAVPAKTLKLYNAGSFFDAGAIPRADHAAIAELCRCFPRIIVECHPTLVGPKVIEFQGLLPNSQLEVALGLETAHPEILARLNKRMTPEDFAYATKFLRAAGIEVRAFVLVKPPFQNDEEALEWAVRSAEFAFEAGAGVVSLIPTRSGNGALDELARRGEFTEPTLGLLETAFDQVLALRRGRVFVDLWDLERFHDGGPTYSKRRERLAQMNLTQRLLPRVEE